MDTDSAFLWLGLLVCEILNSRRHFSVRANYTFVFVVWVLFCFVLFPCYVFFFLKRWKNSSGRGCVPFDFLLLRGSKFLSLANFSLPSMLITSFSPSSHPYHHLRIVSLLPHSLLCPLLLCQCSGGPPSNLCSILTLGGSLPLTQCF